MRQRDYSYRMEFRFESELLLFVIKYVSTIPTAVLKFGIPSKFNNFPLKEITFVQQNVLTQKYFCNIKQFFFCIIKKKNRFRSNIISGIYFYKVNTCTSEKIIQLKKLKYY